MLAIYSLPLGLLTAGALISRIGFSGTVTLTPWSASYSPC